MIGKDSRAPRGITLLLTLCGLLLISVNAFAATAGGACPSGANYTNPASPQGSLVTLSSLGVTSCYYIAANGSDSNAGTSESAPWLHAPQMPNCSGNCATVQNATLPAGTGIILRGGDTWHFGNSSATPYTGGAWEMNASPYPNGTSTNPLYFGFDLGWYAGGSFARPILTVDNSVCNSSTTGTLPDGATCTATTDSYGQPSYYVSSCPYQVGSANNMIDFGNREYYIFDNFEILGLCLNHVGQPSGEDTYLRYGGAAGPLTFQNLYIHGSSHVQFAGPVTSAACTGSTVCCCTYAFQGSVTNGSVGETVTDNVVDFSDSDPAGEILCSGGFYNVSYNAFRYTTSCLPGTLHLFHDNLDEYFFEDGHSNLLESNDIAGTNAIYNNVFRHIENLVSTNGGVFLWFGPASGATDYIFNNLLYDAGDGEYLNVGGTGLTAIKGDYVFFNNTWQTNHPQTILNCQNQSVGSTVEANNHYIDDQSPYSTCSSLTKVTSLWQSNTSSGSAPSYSGANTSPHVDQYTGGETYGYSPVASTNSTVGAGTNEYPAYCGALGTAGLTSAQTACESDTSYGIIYNSKSHTVSSPARTSNSRPASSAWDIGAYEFSSGSSVAPNPPAGLTFTVI